MDKINFVGASRAPCLIAAYFKHVPVSQDAEGSIANTRFWHVASDDGVDVAPRVTIMVCSPLVELREPSVEAEDVGPRQAVPCGVRRGEVDAVDVKPATSAVGVRGAVTAPGDQCGSIPAIDDWEAAVCREHAGRHTVAVNGGLLQRGWVHRPPLLRQQAAEKRHEEVASSGMQPCAAHESRFAQVAWAGDLRCYACSAFIGGESSVVCVRGKGDDEVIAHDEDVSLGANISHGVGGDEHVDEAVSAGGVVVA